MNIACKARVALLRFAVGLLPAVTLGAAQAQILSVNSDTLTTVLPAGTSRVHDVRAIPQQRGVGVDGTLRAGGGFSWALGGNPLDGDPSGGNRMGDMNLALGTYSPTEIDLALPAQGAGRWVIGRTYNQRQIVSSADHTSDGPQGKNWMQISQPEIVFHDDGTDTKDTVYLVYGADRFAEFVRVGGAGTYYVGVNGAAGFIQYVSGSPDLWEYTDQHGVKTTFFGGNTASNKADWQLWKIEDQEGNKAFVGHATTPTTAVTNGYNADGTISVAYDGFSGGGRRYTYSYASSRLTQVKAEVLTGGSSWGSSPTMNEIARVSYTYSSDFLTKVKVRTALTDSGSTLSSGVYHEKTMIYRYYAGPWANSDGSRGAAGDLKMVVDFEGVRRFDWGEDGAESPPVMDDGQDAASDASLKPFSAAYFEYPSGDRKISKVFFNGECGCSGGTNGTHEFTYGTNGSYSDTSGYTTAWSNRTVILRPDATYETRYFDEAAQAMSRVVTNTDPASSPTQTWVTQVVRDANGCVSEVHSPASHSGYTHSTGAFTSRTSASGTLAGLVTVYTRLSSGDFKGFVAHVYVKPWAGSAGSDYEYRTSRTFTGATYTPSGGPSIVRPFTDVVQTYHTSTSSSGTGGTYDEIDHAYTMYSGTATNLDILAIKESTTTLPAVATSKNGRGTGSTNTTKSNRYYRKDGTPAFSKEAVYADDSTTQVVTYSKVEGGLGTISAGDAKTDTTSFFDKDPGTDFGLTENSSGKQLKTESTFDALGRNVTTTLPTGRVTQAYYSKLADGRMVSLRFPRTAAGPNYYGPVSYSVVNLAGKVEFSGIIGGGTTTTALTGWIDETDADPITAVDNGTLSGVSTQLYNKSSSQLTASRMYFLLPGSGAGTAGTNYDETSFAYDNVGRRVRSKAPDGTINRVVYDALGRATEQSVGTNDPDEVGTDDMVTTAKTAFDGGAAGGNSHVTSQTTDPDGNWGTTGDQRVTTFIHDYRGRTIVTQNPVAPHTVTAYDTRGRATATATYSTVSGLTSSAVPTTVTNRLGLSETFYDDRGQVWKTVMHQIDDTDGSDDDTLTTLNWFDAVGRQIKSIGPGGITKTAYDRLGRAERSFVLASTDDASATDKYAAAFDLTGDIVLEERQAYFDAAGRNLMRVSIARHSDDGDDDALDEDADLSLLDWTTSKVRGRASITTMSYDEWDRVKHTAMLGTNNNTNYDRDSDAVDYLPARSATVLVTSTVFNANGTVHETTDPMDRESRTLYDGANRPIATIANYTGGSTSTANRDTDVYTRMTYAYGHQTELWVDLDADGTKDSDDQVTIYTFGVPKGGGAGDSLIAHNGLLYKVQYPDSSGGSDVMTYAYNALGQPTWTKDQNGTILTTTYDLGGRSAASIASSLGTNIDGAVRRVETAFTSKGQVDTVTQYDATSSGTATDQLQYTYDDWGNLTTFNQDPDSSIGTSGRAAFSTSWAYAISEPANGRPRIQRSSTTLPGSRTVSYSYGAANSIADDFGRVDMLTLNAVDLATYTYTGMAQLASTLLEEAKLDRSIHASGSDYANVDVFGRVTRDKWTRSPSSVIHDVLVYYDQNSSIKAQEDNTPGVIVPSTGAALDAMYTMDDLNRLTRSHEGVYSSGSGGSIASPTRDERWLDGSDNLALSQTGNWMQRRLDLNGDTDFTDTDELDDTGTFNKANEWLTRDTDSNASVNYTLAHDDAGNMTDDGRLYEYVYDAWGRLRKVNRTSNQTLVTEYRYNGLGYRTSWKYDTDIDNDTDGSDLTYWFTYDDRWRVVATYRGSDSDPKEVFVHHAAGLDGRGGSSYIDSVVLRDRDETTGWTSSADSTPETRSYYVQNWRNDVVAMTNIAGRVNEWVRYSAYGEARVRSRILGDYEGDGDIDGTDTGLFANDLTNHVASADVDEDGDWDSTDTALFSAAWNQSYENWGPGLSLEGTSGNRLGYAGYHYDPATSKYHVRHRVYIPELGRWTKRDPLGYVDGMGLYGYVRSAPLKQVDKSGSAAFAVTVPVDDECTSAFARCRQEAEEAYRTRGSPGSGGPPGPYPDTGDKQFREDMAACTDRRLLCQGRFPVGPQSPERIREWEKGPFTVPNLPGIGHCFFCFPDGDTIGFAGNGWEENRPEDKILCQVYPADWHTQCVKNRIREKCQSSDGEGTSETRWGCYRRFRPDQDYIYPFNDCNDGCACMREAFEDALQTCSNVVVSF